MGKYAGHFEKKGKYAEYFDGRASVQSPEPKVTEPERGVLETIGDVGTSLLKGAIAVPEAAVGLADIVTGGHAGKLANDLGFRPGEAKRFIDDNFISEPQKKANKAVSDAEGFFPTLEAVIENPSTIAHTALESLPSMGAGGVLGKATKLGSVMAGAVGEGIVGAGSSAENIRQQTDDKLLSTKQLGLAALSGAGTAAFGAAGGKIAQRLGIGDIDTALAGGVVKSGSKNIVRRIVEGGISEGVFEELPQSVQEQVLSNAALNKPLMDGVEESAAMGLLTGGAMGAGFNAANGAIQGNPEPKGPLSRAVNKSPVVTPALPAPVVTPALPAPEEGAVNKSPVETLALPAPVEAIEFNRYRQPVSDDIVFSDGSAANSRDYYQQRVDEHGDTQRALEETYQKLTQSGKDEILALPPKTDINLPYVDDVAVNAKDKLINEKQKAKFKPRPEQLVYELEAAKDISSDPKLIRLLNTEIKLIKRGKNREALATRLQDPKDRITKRLSPELLVKFNNAMQDQSEQVLDYDSKTRENLQRLNTPTTNGNNEARSVSASGGSSSAPGTSVPEKNLFLPREEAGSEKDRPIAEGYAIQPKHIADESFPNESNKKLVPIDNNKPVISETTDESDITQGFSSSPENTIENGVKQSIEVLQDKTLTNQDNKLQNESKIQKSQEAPIKKKSREGVNELAKVEPVAEPAPENNNIINARNVEEEKSKPPILVLKKNKYINDQVKAQGLNKESPGYKSALNKIKQDYDADLEKAEFSLPFNEFKNLSGNDGHSDDVLKQTYDAVRDELGIVDSITPENKAAESTGSISSVSSDKNGQKETKIDIAAKDAALSPKNKLTEPTEKQKEAGNYKLGHTSIQGLNVSIENPKGSTRSGTDTGGKKWSVNMKSHYGYFKGTIGKDKDHVDAFIGDDAETAKSVFIVNQVDPKTGKFDEHKVMMGYADKEAATNAYNENYDKNWNGLGSIVEMPVTEFKEWVKDGKKTNKPANESKEQPIATAEKKNTSADKAADSRGNGEAEAIPTKKPKASGKVRQEKIANKGNTLKSESKNDKNTGSTVSEITELLPRRIKKMVDSGRVIVVQSGDSNVKGYYKESDDTITLVADNLTESTLNSVLSHELYHRSEAIDHKLRNQLSALNKRLQLRFNLAAKGKGTQSELEAYNSVIDADTPAKDQLAEFKAYLVEIYNTSPESLSESMRKWVKDLFAAIRAVLIRNGILPKNITPSVLNALAKYGIKSSKSLATNNSGKSTDKQGGDVKFSKAGDAVKKVDRWLNGEPITQSIGGNLGLADESRVEKATRLFQDGFNRVKKLQSTLKDNGGEVNELNDVYRAEERSSGITAARLDDLRDNNVTPLIEAMKEKDINLGQLDSYVMAKHAQERNEYISSINPKMQDGGSGLNNSDAAKILADFEQQGLSDKLQSLADRVYQINDQTLNALVHDGLIDAKTYHQYVGQYENYIPLKGKEGTDERGGSGQGYSVGGSGLKSAMGRGHGNISESPVAHSIAQAENAIIRAEKARVGQTLMRLMKDNPDPNFWTVTKANYSKFIDLDGELFEGFDKLPEGLIEGQDVHPVMAITAAEKKLAKEEDRKPKNQAVYKLDPSYKFREDVFSVMAEGKLHQITIKDQILAEQLKKLNSNELNNVLQNMGAVNRFLAMINTALNPEFVITNLERDLQTAGINLAGEHSAKMAKQVMLDVPMAAKGIFKSVFKKEGHEKNEWSKLYQELKHEGGTIGFFGLEDITTKVNKIEKSLIQDDSYLGKSKEVLAKIQETILDANQSVENASRLAAYKAAKDAGMSKKQAASLSKNLTVNFNRRGELAPVINAMYLFANASVQGTARLFTAMKHQKVRKIVSGIAATSFALAMYNMAAGGDDDDGISHWEKLSEYTKQTNLIIMHPDGSGDYSKFKMPYGYNVFWYAGVGLHDLMFGKNTTALGQSGHLLSTAVNAFNPIQGADFLDTITPTILKPVEQDYRNINFMMTPIRPENPFYRYDRPESDKAFNSTNSKLRGLSKFLNSATGGDDTKAGFVDISPETMKHYVGWLTGGAGMTVARTLGTTSKLATGETIRQKEVPFLRTLGGSVGTHYDTEKFYKAISDVAATKEQLKRYRSERNKKAGDYFKENRKVIALNSSIAKHKKRIKVLRNRKILSYRAGNYDMADKMNQAIATEMRLFIKRYNLAKEG